VTKQTLNKTVTILMCVQMSTFYNCINQKIETFINLCCVCHQQTHS